MKSIRVHQFGGIENLVYEEAPDPSPNAGEILVKVKAAGINPLDLAIRSGKHPMSTMMTLPYIPGVEAAGIVESIGPECTNFEVGDKVFGRAIGGSYCEWTKLAARETCHKPTEFSFEEAAGIPIVFMTAWQALFNRANLQQGETVLIHAGGGGVGTAAIQLAKRSGATVLTTVGSSEKADRAKNLGADHAILYKESSFDEEVKRLTDGQGVDVIIETVAAENLPKDIQALRINGRIVVIGNGTGKGPEATLPVGPSLFKELRLFSMTLNNAGEEAPDIMRGLKQAFAEGNTKPQASVSFPLKDAAQAQQTLISGQFFGKISLSPIE